MGTNQNKIIYKGQNDKEKKAFLIYILYIASREQGLTKYKVKRKLVHEKQSSISTYIVRIIYSTLFTL
jgi:hypothetical protein